MWCERLACNIIYALGLWLDIHWTLNIVFWQILKFLPEHLVRNFLSILKSTCVLWFLCRKSFVLLKDSNFTPLGNYFFYEQSVYSFHRYSGYFFYSYIDFPSFFSIIEIFSRNCSQIFIGLLKNPFQIHQFFAVLLIN